MSRGGAESTHKGLGLNGLNGLGRRIFDRVAHIDGCSSISGAVAEEDVQMNRRGAVM
jgi:hypothetical protein